MIEDIIDKLPLAKTRKIICYNQDRNSGRELIYQLILNNFALKQLDLKYEQPTKNIFQRLKGV